MSSRAVNLARPLGFSLAFSLLMSAPAAQAADKEAAAKEEEVKTQCQESYVKAQEARVGKDLNAARELTVVCAQDACVDFIRKDCTQWLAELDKLLPTIVVAVKDGAGQDLVDVEVMVDGALFTDELNGTALAINPGKHEFVFTRGKYVVKKTIVIREGEKGRTISVQLGETPKKPEEKPGTGGGATLGPKDLSSPIAAYVFTGVSVVGLGVFAFVGLNGQSKEDSLDRSCSPSCTDDQVDDVRSQYLLADIGLGVGIVSGVVAAVLFATHDSAPAEPQKDTARLRFDVGPTRGGSFATLAGRF